MELKTLGKKVKSLTDGGEDRGVSPVIGVILMVAITVILAAVIGAFVLGLGDNMGDSAPQASFSFDYTEDGAGDDTLEISHKGGESIAPGQIEIVLSDGSALGSGSDFNGAGDNVQTGNTATLTYADLTTETVQVIWTSDSGGSSSVLAEWKGPDA